MAKKTKPSLRAVERVAMVLEKARLAEYVDLMQKPLRFAWMNFWGGLWRGVGLAIGGTVVALCLLLLLAKGLRLAFEHLGGLPWVGEQAKAAVGWLLEVIEQSRRSAK